MLLKVAIIVLIIYIIVVTRSRIRLPNPALQATVDVLQAATLKDEHVMQMARKYIDYADAQNALLPVDDPYAERLDRLTSRYVAVNGVPLNFRVYKTAQINAFATADGSIRIFSGLMDLMNDDELMAIVGHEMAITFTQPDVPRMPTTMDEVRMFSTSSSCKCSVTLKNRLPEFRRSSDCFPFLRTSR